jgi:hypothetical protein
MQTVSEREESRRTESDEREYRSALNGKTMTGKITVFIKSRRKVVTTNTIVLPQQANRLSPVEFSVPRQIVVYERVLDDDQKAVLDMSIELAKSMGMELEVKDEGKRSISRLLGFVGTRSWPKAPSVSFTEYGGKAPKDVSNEIRGAIQKLGQLSR